MELTASRTSYKSHSPGFPSLFQRHGSKFSTLPDALVDNFRRVAVAMVIVKLVSENAAKVRTLIHPARHYQRSRTMSHHCPSCGKFFEDHTSVARHMSQPRSGCNTWLEDLINSTTSNQDHPMDSPDGSDIEPVQDVPGLRDDFYDFGDFGAEEGGVSHGGGTERECSSDFVTDHFPNPPLAYQDGYTFLGLFDSDENSIHRKTNLYYPFSSRRDWQLAAWLLRSGLSMGKIDSFLSLEMVSVRTSNSLSSLELMAF